MRLLFGKNGLRSRVIMCDAGNLHSYNASSRLAKEAYKGYNGGNGFSSGKKEINVPCMIRHPRTFPHFFLLLCPTIFLPFFFYYFFDISQ